MNKIFAVSLQRQNKYSLINTTHMKMNNVQVNTGETKNFIQRTDSINSYVSMIRNNKPFDKAIEDSMICEYQMTHDVEIRNKIVNSHQLFIYSAAKHFTNDPDEVLDLVSEGTLGLIEAIDKYDSTIGTKFLSYAVSYIKRNMIMFFMKNKTVRRDVDCRMGSLIEREKDNFYKQQYRYPTVDELADILNEKFNIEIKDKNNLHSLTFTSTNIRSNDGDTDEAIDTIFSSYVANENDYLSQIEKDDTKVHINAALSKLTEREADIIKMIYGIDYPYSFSAEDIGEKYNMTAVRVRQIRDAALKKLKYSLTA